MNTSTPETLLVRQHHEVVYITLNRPQVRNAMNLIMVEELRHQLNWAAQQHSRLVILRGQGGSFCAGADVQDLMRARIQATTETSGDPFACLNRSFGQLLQEAEHLPCVLMVVLEGVVLGGGFGLACVSDLAIAHAATQFRLPETSLGLIPAQIAPFVVKRIGLAASRRLALTGGSLTAEQAVALGLVHEHAENDTDLELTMNRYIEQVLRCAPEANRTTKALLHRSLPLLEWDSLLDTAAQQFALAVQGDEGMEGTMAFMQKRLPNWACTARD